MEKKKMTRGKRNVIIGIIIAVVLIMVFFNAIVTFITDYWWFKDLGYTQVFLKKFFTELGIAIPSFLVVTVLMSLYMRGLKRSYSKKVDYDEEEGMSDLKIKRISIGVSVLIGLIVSYMMTTTLWKQLLYATHSTKFGKADPVFNLDISFYVFKLAFLKSILSISYSVVVIFVLVTMFYYMFLMAVRRPKSYASAQQDVYEAENIRVSPFKMLNNRRSTGADSPAMLLKIAQNQLLILAVVFFALIACSFAMKQMDLLYTDSGTVFGAGFKSSLINMNIYRIEAVLAIVAAVLTVRFTKKKKYRKLLYMPVIMIVVAMVGGVIGAAVQSLIVSPNELNREKPYLEYNVKYTQEAYDLSKVKTEKFDANGTLTGENIKNNQPTISNIRINDFEPSKQFYNQTQSIRTYYSFNDVDVDRYDIDDMYTQTFLSAREMNSDNLEDGVSWLSKHLKYTHGYGLTLSRVDAITDSGQPDMIIDNIPPESDSKSLKITRPEIYYGEMTNDYAITNTNEKEFDYPSGDDNKYSVYKGSHGIKLTPVKRLLYAINQKNIRILVSSNITSKSKLLYVRNVEDRVKKIAPFLQFDSDPYITISDSGKLYWIIDAYTMTRYYPYSETTQLKDGSSINYMRNPVKVTVDAYDGSVNFYKVDDEPIADTISKIYPNLLKDISEMPDGLEKHIRYSNTLFDVQAKIYQRYHMSDISVFYQNEDKWSIATNIYGQKEVDMTPNYFIMDLPGQDKEEFISSIPFTPSGKKNMTGLMVARCDEGHYGELVLYKLPKDKVVYGPMQIESQIDQNTEISKEFSLWNSSGSTYTRGDMFVIPIDDSLLYVEPVYLESSTDTSLPEVKRVIIAYHDRIAYGSTLAESLRSLFDLGADYEVDAGTSAGTGTSGAGGSSAANVGGADENAGSGAGAGASIPDLVSKASKAYDNAQAAMKEGDWAKYGQYQEELKSYLDQLDAASGSSGSASVEAASGDQAAGTDDSGSNNADNADKTAQN
ncbi:MAG: UPF0182 family protein [Anaerovoracaceae bacterium]|nr:UPF0182 family protein [Bacillota bacterium]MDY2670768.1 UPF0182 family protein [Anaerovoracaceae bacterium]